jgi:hypothetical protein
MSSRTTIAITAALFFTAIATLYVYWTRTPQYTLLHVLDAYATADHQAAGLYIEKEPTLKKGLRVTRRTETVIHHLAGLQNETLARAYRVTVEASRIDGKNADLLVRLNQTAYRLIFHEQNDGRWKLIDFEKREQFSTQAVLHMTDHPLLMIARL